MNDDFVISKWQTSHEPTNQLKCEDLQQSQFDLEMEYDVPELKQKYIDRENKEADFELFVNKHLVLTSLNYVYYG